MLFTFWSACGRENPVMGAQITTWLVCTRARFARTAEYEGAQLLFGDIRWAGAGGDCPIGMVSTNSPSPRAGKLAEIRQGG